MQSLLAHNQVHTTLALEIWAALQLVYEHYSNIVSRFKSRGKSRGFDMISTWEGTSKGRGSLRIILNSFRWGSDDLGVADVY